MNLKFGEGVTKASPTQSAFLLASLVVIFIMKLFYSIPAFLILLGCKAHHNRIEHVELQLRPAFHDYCKVLFNNPADSTVMSLVRYKKFQDLEEALRGVLIPIDTFIIKDNRVKQLIEIMANSETRTKNRPEEVIFDGIGVAIIKSYSNHIDTTVIQSPSRFKNMDHYRYIDMLFKIIDNAEATDLRDYATNLRPYFDDGSWNIPEGSQRDGR